ncbi:tRNA-dihydrouridine synthase family protein [Candidatus Nomurabacteria bacterium]|nr:tRNA-dihydrouridine synthase family protein [Candidatus Nomurabacteria bacterium]
MSIMKNFWQKLNKPIVVIAPMADVTDVAFRTMFAKYGKPDVMWTEFVSADGLVMAPDNNPDETGLSSKQKLLKDLEFTDAERPIVAQLFGSNVERMEKATRLCQELGFDGIDINMGCPDRSIERQGSGAAMIKNPESARAIIRAAKKGAPNLPISVKTRLGYNQDQLEEWLPELLSENPAVVTIHARTRKEMSKVPARWERIKRAVEIRDEYQKGQPATSTCHVDLPRRQQTLIFGNGDVIDLEDAQKKIDETGCDGVMIGRGIFGNPWRFNRGVNRGDISIEDRLRVMVEHTKLFEKLLPHKSFNIMKKHYKAYLSGVASAKTGVDGFGGAKELRMRLMEAKDGEEVEKIVVEFIGNS